MRGEDHYVFCNIISRRLRAIPIHLKIVWRSVLLHPSAFLSIHILDFPEVPLEAKHFAYLSYAYNLRSYATPQDLFGCYFFSRFGFESQICKHSALRNYHFYIFSQFSCPHFHSFCFSSFVSDTTLVVTASCSHFGLERA